MPIDDVSHVSGRGTVVMGRIESGTVKSGDEVEIVGNSKPAKKAICTGVEAFKKQAEEGQTGNQVIYQVLSTRSIHGCSAMVKWHE
jgi:elongation factor Tu